MSFICLVIHTHREKEKEILSDRPAAARVSPLPAAPGWHVAFFCGCLSSISRVICDVNVKSKQFEWVTASDGHLDVENERDRQTDVVLTLEKKISISLPTTTTTTATSYRKCCSFFFRRNCQFFFFFQSWCWARAMAVACQGRTALIARPSCPAWCWTRRTDVIFLWYPKTVSQKGNWSGGNAAPFFRLFISIVPFFFYFSYIFSSGQLEFLFWLHVYSIYTTECKWEMVIC